MASTNGQHQLYLWADGEACLGPHSHLLIRNFWGNQFLISPLGESAVDKDCEALGYYAVFKDQNLLASIYF